MKLSMWILEEELRSYPCESHIKDGNCVIRGFRIHQYDRNPAGEMLSVCRAADLGINDARVVLANRQDKIFVKGSFDEICNQVIRVFEKYHAWSARLNKAIVFSQDPFQKILSIGNEIIQQPMYFGRNDMQLLAITEEYSSSEVFTEWDTIKKIHTIPMTALDRVKHQMAAFPVEDLTSTDMDITPSLAAWDVHYNFIIRRQCKFNNKVWGHLILFYKGDAVTKGFLQILEYLGRIFERLLSYSGGSQSIPESTLPFLTDLINGVQVDDVILSNLYSQIGWTEGVELVVYLLNTSKEAVDDVLFNWIYNHLRIQVKNSVFLKLETEIIIIVNKDDSEHTTIVKRLTESLQNFEILCGASLPFKGLQRLSSFYQQARLAVSSSLAEKRKINYFRDCAYEGIVRAFSNQFNYSDWIYPPVYELIELDQNKGTTYYKTLSSYLKNMGHLGNTVSDLYIHRNTLTNRLAFIEEKLGMDLHDKKNMYYLDFCIKLLESSE